MNAMTDAQHARYEEIRQQWQASIQEMHDLPDGYALRFPPETALLLALAEFVALERLCCPFLRFEIVLEAEGAALWLRLGGREGVKAFLAAEFGLNAPSSSGLMPT
jgi:hypothetical protein